MTEQEFTKAGFTVVGTENNENKLLSFLKENYPSVIRDNEINIQELKAIAGLPIDEKVNGYGLNFVGRNFARAKYAQKTEKELSLNTSLSRDIDTTQNLVLKGDNLDSLKILKNYYNGLIKCIYIDPPYNTTSDEFVYPDKFDKEETEVLGLANLSEDDFARMDFSFKTKKSHNGWLAFMYPRLLLARDLLSKDGVIFISIDDNEQANLKLLCDEVFGEENCIANYIWKSRSGKDHTAKQVSINHEYILCFSKNIQNIELAKDVRLTKAGKYSDEKGSYSREQIRQWGTNDRRIDRPTMYFSVIAPDGSEVFPIKENGEEGCWRISQKRMEEQIEKRNVDFVYDDEKKRWNVYAKKYEGVRTQTAFNSILEEYGTSANGTLVLKELFPEKVFETVKPLELIKYLINLSADSIEKDYIVLDFFAGSGTAGHAVMQLNAEDGGNRKFILCQIDEPIKEDKPAYQFCVDNNLPTVISSITIERLRRAGEKIAKDIETENSKPDLFEEDKKQIPDIGFKVFDSIKAPKLQVNETTLQITITENGIDALSRIYNMIFTVGLDEPTQVPEMVLEGCIYKIGKNYYITNSEKIGKDDFSNAIKNAYPVGGKVFIDGWTASLNATLQNYKEDVKIVF